MEAGKGRGKGPIRIRHMEGSYQGSSELATREEPLSPSPYSWPGTVGE